MYYITDRNGYVISSQEKKPTIEELKEYSNISPETDDEFIQCSYFEGTEEDAQRNDCEIATAIGGNKCQCGQHH